MYIFQVGFHLKYQLINLILPSFDFFHSAEAFTLLCVQFFIIIHILVLILQSTCFICTTWKRKQTMEQQLQHACERTILKQKQNQQVTFKLRI